MPGQCFNEAFIRRNCVRKKFMLAVALLRHHFHARLVHALCQAVTLSYHCSLPQALCILLSSALNAQAVHVVVRSALFNKVVEVVQQLSGVPAWRPFVTAQYR